MGEQLRQLARTALATAAGWLLQDQDRKGETWPQEIERRLAAIEEHLRHLPPERTM
jgi:hypothetical protein